MRNTIEKMQFSGDKMDSTKNNFSSLNMSIIIKDIKNDCPEIIE